MSLCCSFGALARAGKRAVSEQMGVALEQELCSLLDANAR